MSNSIAEIEDAPCLFCVGTNMTETHPVIALRVKKALRNGARLIVADPRRTELAGMAHRFLQLRSGSDTALFNAMAGVIIEEGLVDEEFVSSRTCGYEELAAFLKPLTPEWATGVTGVPAAEIRRSAREYAGAERAGIYYTLGVTEQTNGVGNVRSLVNLALLTGNLGKRSAGINPLRGQNNVQGAGDCGALPTNYPGFQKVDDPASRAKFEAAWGVALGPKPGITKLQALDRAVSGELKAMYILGENTLLTDPNLSHTQRALESLEFLVVHDIFMTETAKLADVVLPGATFAEQDGTFTNSERRVQRIRQAVPPKGRAMPDWWVVCQVGRRIAPSVKMDFKSAEEVFDELCRLSPIYHGMSFERLDGTGLQWPCPDALHPGTEFLHEGRFENGRGVLSCVEYLPPGEQTDAEFPFMLTTGRRLSTYHTNTQIDRSEGFDQLLPHEWLELHPVDAARLSVNKGSEVVIRSRRGEVRALALPTEKCPQGLVFLSFAFQGTQTNRVTNPEGDPVTGTPAFKMTAVAIISAEAEVS